MLHADTKELAGILNHVTPRSFQAIQKTQGSIPSDDSHNFLVVGEEFRAAVSNPGNCLRDLIGGSPWKLCVQKSQCYISSLLLLKKSQDYIQTKTRQMASRICGTKCGRPFQTKSRDPHRFLWPRGRRVILPWFCSAKSV